ncbi:hypothetical protein H2204_000886 [Knufia peltigerae]|uniref:Uncharacterized protein n=1 Tax=Knufia peltigerae TaxID=1002370 RepID=A0AA38YEB5_9EURO|nr:hypothetical protein H2204_000886 [Knufia peltigerae]
MRTVKKLLSPLLSCFGVRSHGDEYEASDLKSLPNPASASSMSLPANTVPHSVGHSGSHTTDTDALRQIFRSSSSVRGYQTALRPHERTHQRESSFDADFKFGTKRSDDQKQPGRIEQLGKHIKQKLSESGVSKSSSKLQIGSDDTVRVSKVPQPAPLEPENQEAALSQRSTGLLELLMSRSGSEGGYDSDAKSIQTTMLKCSDATLKLSPQAAEALLHPSSRRSSIKHDLAGGSPTKPTSRPALGPPLPSAPPRSTFLVDGQSDAPGSLSRQSSDVADNAVAKLHQLPTYETPPLDTAHPESASLNQDKNKDSQGMSKRMGDSMDGEKRDSVVSTTDNNRNSLISNLDTSLINAITQFGERDSTEIKTSTEDKPSATSDQAKPTPNISSSPRMATMSSKDDVSGRYMTSVDESDCDSIHLYNMRISQRLASPSFIAGSSRPDTSHTTIIRPNKNSMEYCPTTHLTSPSSRMPGTTTSEHNRLPSDPQTMRLFESESSQDIPRLVWRPSTSSTYAPQLRGSRPIVSRGDSSSYYCSDDEAADLDEPHSGVPRRNPNSIAIGGRSETVSFPLRSSYPSLGSLSVAEESAWFGRQSLQQQRDAFNEDKPGPLLSHHRSVSMPGRPAEGRRHLRNASARRTRALTEANEALSVISYGELQDARREQLTEISAQEVHDTCNERLSEIEIPRRRRPIRSESDSGSPCRPLWSRPRQYSTASDMPSTDRCSKPILDESTTDIWRRTLKRALDEPTDDSMGGFLTAPKFDRDGRRRNRRSSLSTDNSNPEVTSHILAVEKGPTHVIRSRQRLSVSEEIPRTNTEQHEVTASETHSVAPVLLVEKKRKKSILDFGKRFATQNLAEDEPGSSSSSTPLKDLLGVWSRFPSHTRNERCGSAGRKDGVIVEDFAKDQSNDVCPPRSTPTTTWNRSLTPLGMYTPGGSLRRLPFGRKHRMDKGKTKSMPLPRSANQNLVIRVKKGRRGLVGRWKKLYRSSSSDFKAYVDHYGHRSSISLGANARNPDLEVIPGLEHFREQSSKDGSDSAPFENFTSSAKGEPAPSNSEPWAQVYKDCVGSLSALRSDADIRSMSEWTDQVCCEGNETMHRLLSSELRDSTTNFEAQLGEELEIAKKGLLRKIENSSRGHRLEISSIHLKQD